jgi:hypothetical protein
MMLLLFWHASSDSDLTAPSLLIVARIVGGASTDSGAAGVLVTAVGSSRSDSGGRVASSAPLWGWR